MSEIERLRCPVAFDHESPEHARSWPEQFQEMRKCPITWTDKHDGYWIATRYRDVLTIAQNADVFSSDKTFDPATGQVKGGLSIPPFPTPRGIPIECDSPEWDAYRKILNRALTPKVVEARRARTQTFAAALIDRFIERGTCDIVDDLTSPLPALATMDMFGLPLEQWREFADPLHTMQYAPKHTPEFAAAAASLGWIRRQVEEVVARRRKDPRDDVLTYFAECEIDGIKLDDDTIWELAWNLMVGGVDTTTALTANVLHYLSRHPDERQRLIDNPEMRPIAREEFVRFFTPVHGMARNALRDIVHDGQAIREGDRVYLAYSAANRDPEVFDNPETPVLDRFPNRHLGFGAGKHRCVGSFQARMMFEVMLDGVLTRLPDYQVNEATSQQYPSVGIINGWKAVPARFTPGPKVGASIL